MKNSSFKDKIREAIIESILEKELMEPNRLWQDYMQREVAGKFPPESNAQFKEVVCTMIAEGFFEVTDGPHLRVTTKGQDLVFLNGLFTIDRLENTILTHLRDEEFFANHVWPRQTYWAYRDKQLNVYEKYIFNRTIEKMIKDGVFTRDNELNLRLTQAGQDLIYGK